MSVLKTSESLFLNIGRAKSFKVHPVVVFSILDHFKRRDKDAKFVVGTLLGEVIGNDVVIKNCFPVPYTVEEGKVELDVDYHYSMLSLHERVNSKEIVVGYYSTSTALDAAQASIHSSYATECNDPCLITVDTGLTNASLDISAFVGKTIKNKFSMNDILTRFEEVPCSLTAYEAEKIGVDALINGEPEDESLDAPATILKDFDNLEMSLSNLLESIQTISEYVERVQKGEIEGDEEIGRAIYVALSAVPNIDKESFAHLFNNKIQDLLMIVYLSNLTRSQLALADRIQGLLV